jgi:hypothetical protein
MEHNSRQKQHFSFKEMVTMGRFVNPQRFKKYSNTQKKKALDNDPRTTDTR